MKINIIISFIVLIVVSTSLFCHSNKEQNRTEIKCDDTIVDGYILSFSKIIKNEYFSLKQNHSIDTAPMPKFIRDDMLIFQIGNKNTLMFKDCVKTIYDADKIKYHYLGRLLKQNRYLIIKEYYESSEIIVLDSLSGNYSTIWNIPKMAKNDSIFFTISASLGYDIMPNGIQLCKFSNNGRILTEWEFEAKDWEPVNAKWKNDSTIYVEKRIINDYTNREKDKIEYIMITWKKVLI
jgi:hypothetical protein